MSAISLKSITGITSITTPAGVDDQLTLHNNNTTEAVKLDIAGNVHVNNHLAVTGVTTHSDDVKFTGNNYNVLWDKSDNSLKFDALAKIKLNDSFQFYHNTNGVLHNTSGITFIYGSGNGNISIQAQSGYQNIACSPNGGTSLYYQGNQKLYTVSDGVYINDNLGIQDSIQHILDTNTKIRFPADDTITFETAGSERLRIDSNGDIGINDTSPPWPLSIRKAVSGGTVSGGAGIFMGIQDNFPAIQMNTASDAHGCIIDMGYSGVDFKGRIEYINGDDYMRFFTDGSERFRITSDGKVSLGTSPHATPAAALHIDYDTNNMLMLDNSTSSTQKMFFAQNGSTNAQIYATSVQGSLVFESDPNDTHNDSLMNFTIDGSSKLRINNTGLIALDNGTAQICMRDSGVVDNAIFYIGGGTRTQTSTTTDFTQICLYDKNSQYNTQTANGSWKSKIKFFAAQMNGGAREGAFVGQDTTYNNFSGSTIKMRSDLIFGTRGDAQTSSSDPATEKLRIRHNGQIQISEPAGTSGDGASLNFYFDNNNTTDVISSIYFSNNVGTVAAIKGETRNGNTNGMITFHTDVSGSSAERMRVNHDGAFCFGNDSARPAEFNQPNGFSLRWDDKGQFQNTVTDTTGGLMNRKGSDGQILTFRRDGTGVGHIGVNASTMYLNFGGTNAAAHQLDDYEEGTWTPTISGASGTFAGQFTKIGNRLFWALQISSLGGSGSFIVQGLPYAVSNGWGGNISISDNNHSPEHIYVFAHNNSSNIYFRNDSNSTYGIQEFTGHFFYCNGVYQTV